MFQPQMELASVTLTVLIDEPRMPEELFGDQIRLKQVLINLTKNALKFTSKGQIKIFATYLEEFELLQCKVVDSGAGLDEEEKKDLFQIFSKAERTQNLNLEGTGIGLYICRKIVENCQGTISVESAGPN